jgi:hypothetical protein
MDPVDPLSLIPLEIPRQDVRFSFLDIRKPIVLFLKESVSPSVISIGECDYLKDAELDNKNPDSISSIPKDFSAPTISDTYIRSVIDIYSEAPSWFKDAMMLEYAIYGVRNSLNCACNRHPCRLLYIKHLALPSGS